MEYRLGIVEYRNGRVYQWNTGPVFYQSTMVHTPLELASSARRVGTFVATLPSCTMLVTLALSSAAAFRGLPAGRPGASRVAPSVRMDIYDGPSPGVETSGKAGLEDGLGKFSEMAPQTDAELAAARASQPDPSAAPAPDVMAAGRSAKTVSFCDTIRVGGKQLAGDVGFDPLAIADTPSALVWYREAEVKHARLAMLAAVGWPLSEQLNLGGLLTADGRAPSDAALTAVEWRLSGARDKRRSPMPGDSAKRLPRPALRRTPIIEPRRRRVAPSAPVF